MSHQDKLAELIENVYKDCDDFDTPYLTEFESQVLARYLLDNGVILQDALIDKLRRIARYCKDKTKCTIGTRRLQHLTIKWTMQSLIKHIKKGL